MALLVVDLRVKKGEQLPWIVPDSLWERIEPLLPKVERRRHHPGRKRLDDRLALQGRRVIALDGETVRLLRGHERAERKRLGNAWQESGPIFARADGSPLRPDFLTVRFHRLVHASGLPPIRLHDLRHGTATLALATGSDLRVVQGTLGHGSIVVTSDIHTTVLPEVYHQSAQAIARLVLARARKTARKARKAAA
ncbi:tyrosine-type recombinase/integrase [Rhizohabitans arisaemae]|uniref:tyrosine-type recombinase/integrase n=1 Tax=Rhizohabitans arisaemae TaxID=2720610 RepID=UPI0024B07D3F|nr:tyrosine-type recombinase/integrase [Rhizohabitans arisaemae]